MELSIQMRRLRVKKAKEFSIEPFSVAKTKNPLFRDFLSILKYRLSSSGGFWYFIHQLRKGTEWICHANKNQNSAKQNYRDHRAI